MTTSAARSTANRSHHAGTADAGQARRDAAARHVGGARSGELSFRVRLALLVDHPWNWRQNQALVGRRQAAKPGGNACGEDVDFRAARGLDPSVIRGLAKDSQWVENHEHVFVFRPTGPFAPFWRTCAGPTCW
jgi:hypothetical protein